MKKAFVLVVALMVAGVANATLTLVAPEEMTVGETVSIGIDTVREKACLTGAIVFDGPVSVGISGVTIVDVGPGVRPVIEDISSHPNLPEFLSTLGIQAHTALYYEVVDVAPEFSSIPDGRMIDAISLTSTNPGVATINLIDLHLTEILDNVCIEIVIPEPTTVGLLGLGVMFIRRRGRKWREVLR